MQPRRIAIILAGVALVASGQAVRGPSDLDRIADRWQAAVGGAKSARKARSVLVRAESTEDGVAGHVEEWIGAGGWRRVTTQGSRTRIEVCRGDVAWERDWNGKVQELRGRDRRGEQTEAYIAALLFGGSVREIAADDNPDAKLTAGDDPGGGDVIAFAPADATPFQVFIDKTTGLPAKFVWKPSGHTVTLTPSEWKETGGLKFPHALRRESPDDGTADTIAVHEIVTGGSKARTSFARPDDGPKDYRFASGTEAGGIPFNFENDHLMVLASVNGSKPIWFMLDTGAEATIINKARVAELGVRPFGASSISGGGNSTDFAFAEVARLTIGGAELLNQRDGVIDLTGLEKIYGMPMGGLLGYDFYSRFIVRVNYDAKTLDLLEPSSFAYSGSGSRVPFVLEGGQPHVASTITVPSLDPIAADMVIDAGAADTVNLASPFVREHRLLEFARKKPAGGPNTMAGSEKEFFAQTSVRGKLASLTLGEFRLEDIPSNLMVGTKGGYASTSFSGTIGEGVLHRFNGIYDYSRNVLILEPNDEFKRPFPGRKTFGATFLSDGPDYRRFTVTGVRKGSPAEAAGFKKDDVVVAADGKPAVELRLADLRKLIADEGVKHVFTMQRGDAAVTLDPTVTLISLDDE